MHLIKTALIILLKILLLIADGDYFILFALDVDAYNVINQRAAEAIDHALVKLYHDDTEEILSNITADARGGSEYAGLFRELCDLNLTNEDSTCHICTYHRLSMMCANLINKYFGTGMVKFLNSLQLLFTYYAIERGFDLDTWKGIWNGLNQSACGCRQVQPILTSWDH